jgi:hypothetical protein
MNIDPWSYVTEFEKALGEYTGAPYVITTDCATHAMELCLRYLNPIHPVQVPKHTYLSVPMMVEKIGATIAFMDNNWRKFYQLKPYPVIDGSVHFEKNCYVPGTFYCVSFQHKKRLSLGRGGAILTDNKEAYEMLLKMRYDGRSMPSEWAKDPVSVIGYHYYMTPEEAQRGLEILSTDSLKPYKTVSAEDYPNLTYFPIFRKHNTEDKSHNGYHDFLYMWEPKAGNLLEIFAGRDGTTSVENTYNIMVDGRTGRKVPYLCNLLYMIYRLQPGVINEFTDDVYMFSVNYNDYLSYALIENLYPNLKNIKIFEIEVLWSKIYPTDTEPAILDWFVENSKGLTTYKNFNNVNKFADNNKIDVTYYTCENGVDQLDKSYLSSLNFKIETFNFFLLNQAIEYSESVKNKSYPFELYKNKENPYFKFLKSNSKKNKILNLNRRPDWHRHLIAQSILGQFEGKDSRATVTWLNEDIKAYYQHPLNNGKSEYFNFEKVFLPRLSEEEMNNFKSGENILKTRNLVFDNNDRENEFTLRYAGVLGSYIDVGLEIVSESIFFGPFGDVSEKSLRPLLLGIPCIIAGGPDSFKILEKLGFKSYDQFTGYKDSERNNVIRFRSIADYTSKLSKMSDAEYSAYIEKLQIKCLPIIQHNQDNFKTGQLIENFKKWIKEIHQ